MKYAKYLLFVLLTATVSCSKDTTEDPVIKAQREAFLAANATGLYRNGETLLLFDKTAHQLLFTPAKRTFRIQDDSGTKFISLHLAAMPTEGQKVRGSITDNMGFNIGAMEEIVLLKSDGQYLRFWSDKQRIGFIFPQIGIGQ